MSYSNICVSLSFHYLKFKRVFMLLLYQIEDFKIGPFFLFLRLYFTS